MLSKNKYRKPVQGNKDQRADKASSWLNFLDSHYSEEVSFAIQRTTAYTDVTLEDILSETKRFAETKNSVYKNDVVTCARAAVTHAKPGAKICVLNFASYTSPGGGFLKGATAQEEALCYSTGLYPCLASKPDWYDKHREEETDSCYSNDYIYSKNVPFIVNGKCYFVDVLTMAAPNNAKSRFSPVEEIFKERMEVAVQIAIKNNVDVMLLGAWGCGVFGNDPKFVADRWKELSKLYAGYIGEFVHPIIDTATYKVFKDVFKVCSN